MTGGEDRGEDSGEPRALTYLLPVTLWQRPGAKGGCFATRKEHEPCFYYVPKILKKAFFS